MMLTERYIDICEQNNDSDEGLDYEECRDLIGMCRNALRLLNLWLYESDELKDGNYPNWQWAEIETRKAIGEWDA
jgi:hypothetical protein